MADNKMPPINGGKVVNLGALKRPDAKQPQQVIDLPVQGCHNCQFWHRSDEQKNQRVDVADAQGACTRFPGTPYLMAGQGIMTIWPHTHSYQKCGEYQLEAHA